MAKSRLKNLYSYLKPHSNQLWLGIFALFLANALGVYIPGVVRDSIDRLESSFNFERLIKYVIFLIILASLMWIIRISSRIFIFGVGRQVEVDLKQTIFQHLLTLEPSYFSINTAGDLINRATSDVDNIRRLIGFAILSLINTIFAYGFTLPTMLMINVNLSLLAISIYPLIFIIVQLLSGPLKDQQTNIQLKLSEISDLIQEDISGISLIKIYGQENNENEAFKHKNKQLLNANLALAKTRNLLFPLIQGIASISVLILLWFGTNYIEQEIITIGDFIALIIYTERLLFPTALLGFVITTYQRGEISIDRIEAILKSESKIKDDSESIPLALDKIKGTITAHNLNYSYPSSEDQILKGLNFTINPGETVAIVGSIASGKSTLAKAILHLLDINKKQLFLDNLDITKIKLEDLRKAISYVPQESFLFSTTIKNNIRYGDPLKEDYEVESAAKQAQIHPEITNFIQQYETIVGERGITLSGGQRQRTSLARALIMDAPILILDDALSSVDNKTATQILANLKTQKNKTVIFITHQLSAVKNADQILVMDKGSIIESGTHEQLLKNQRLYYKLWQHHQIEEKLTKIDKN